MQAPPRMCAVVGTSSSTSFSALPGHAADHLGGERAPPRSPPGCSVGFGSPSPCELSAAARAGPGARRRRVVVRLHHEQDDRPLRPAPHREAAEERERMARDLAEQAERPRHPGRRRRRASSRAAPSSSSRAGSAPARCASPRRVDRRGDRDAGRVVDRPRAGASAPTIASEFVRTRSPTSGPPSPEREEQRSGAEHPRREHDLLGAVAARARRGRRPGPLGRDLPAAAGRRVRSVASRSGTTTRAEAARRGRGSCGRACSSRSCRQPTMQPPQRMHPAAPRAGAAEVRVVDRLPRLAEVDRDLRRGGSCRRRPSGAATWRITRSAGVSNGTRATPSIRRASA